MTLEEVKALQAGDEVCWADPDHEGACSRYFTIFRITVVGEVIQIMDIDGTFLECFAHELE